MQLRLLYLELLVNFHTDLWFCMFCSLDIKNLILWGYGQFERIIWMSIRLVMSSLGKFRSVQQHRMHKVRTSVNFTFLDKNHMVAMAISSDFDKHLYNIYSECIIKVIKTSMYPETFCGYNYTEFFHDFKVKSWQKYHIDSHLSRS